MGKETGMLAPSACKVTKKSAESLHFPLNKKLYAAKKREGSPKRAVSLPCRCPERESNPYGHHWPRDFKSLVSTNSTIWALRCKGTKKS